MGYYRWVMIVWWLNGAVVVVVYGVVDGSSEGNILLIERSDIRVGVDAGTGLFWLSYKFYEEVSGCSCVTECL